MKRRILAVAMLLCAITGAAHSQLVGRGPADAKVPEPPSQPGAYYLGRQEWLPLSHILVSERTLRKWYRAFIPTLAPQGVLVFREAEAPFKIDERKPLFFIRHQSPANGSESGSARDVLMVRLQKKKDRRELPGMSGATIFNWAEKIPNDHIMPSTVNSAGMDAFTITPRDNLVPGEYMLTFGRGQDGGYDFQISSGPSVKQ